MSSWITIEPSPSNLLGCFAALLIVAIFASHLRKRGGEPAVYPHGPVSMQMKPGGHTFIAPDRTLMRVLFKEIYTEQCYDSAPLKPLKDLAAESIAAKRNVVVFDVGGEKTDLPRLPCSSAVLRPASRWTLRVSDKCGPSVFAAPQATSVCLPGTQQKPLRQRVVAHRSTHSSRCRPSTHFTSATPKSSMGLSCTTSDSAPVTRPRRPAA